MKRPFVILSALVLLNAVLLLAGIGRGESKECVNDICIGLVFDVGGLGDKSFNDAAHRGLLRAEEKLNIGFQYVEPGDGSDRESALRQLAQSGHQLVIGVGFIFSDDLRKLAADFPETKFAGIDYSPQENETPRPNLTGLRFREQEGSFLVGALAALKSNTKKVGFIGGMDIPLIHKFDAGYRAGAKHVCPDCEVISSYCGTEPKAFNDPIRGKELTLSQMSRGVDVVYHAAGKSGSGVFGAAREKNAWAIGVDADQFDEAPCCVLTSMIKNVDVAVFDVIEDVTHQRFVNGVVEFGLADEGVGFVYNANNQDRISKNEKARVDALAQDIIDGKIDVPWK